PRTAPGDARAILRGLSCEIARSLQITPRLQQLGVRTMRLTLLLLVQATVISSALSAATLAVTVRTASGQAVRDAVVYAVPERKDFSLPRGVAVMDQRNRIFVPHVIVIQTGTAVAFPN